MARLDWNLSVTLSRRARDVVRACQVQLSKDTLAETLEAILSDPAAGSRILERAGYWLSATEGIKEA